MDNLGTRTLRRDLVLQEGRGDQLWFLVLLVLLVVSVSYAATFVPVIAWRLDSLQVRASRLTALVVGFLTLTVLLSIYLVDQRRALKRTRNALIKQLLRADEAVARSFIDPLTQLFNRHFMEGLLPREVKRTERADGTLALLMVDLDEFKAINSRFGHIEGDHCLRQVAQILRTTFRESDTVIRYGGDEFIVVMPDTNERGAQVAIDRLMGQVVAWNAANPSCGYRMALSCGAACYRRGETLERVIADADRRMYGQKRR